MRSKPARKDGHDRARGKALARFFVTVAAVTPLVVQISQPIGQIKTETGAVMIERAGKTRPVMVGDRVYGADTIITPAHGSVGVTFLDNSLLALGPYSRLSLDQFHFNSTTHQGAFDVSLKKGTLAIKSGQIVKQTPEAMRVRTPVAVLGVRGTEFVVRADGGGV
jgi:hypothetical protein